MGDRVVRAELSHSTWNVLRVKALAAWRETQVQKEAGMVGDHCAQDLTGISVVGETLA